MSGSGLRNWRGEIIHPKASEVDDVQGKDQPPEVTKASSSLSESGKTELPSSPSIKRHFADTKVIRKDEFGRDVVEEKRRKKSKTERKEKKREKKHKRHKHRRDRSSDRSRSPSLQGRLKGTPPPEDPFRPQLDEGRGHTRHRSRYSSRYSSSRSRRHSRGEVTSNSRGHRRRSSSRSRSRSRNRSRSPPSPRSRRRRSVERAWTHNAFDDRSPSPPREVDPMYRPEPETWVSRAGGVYLPRK